VPATTCARKSRDTVHARRTLCYVVVIAVVVIGLSNNFGFAFLITCIVIIVVGL